MRPFEDPAPALRHLDLSDLPADTYVSFAEIAPCRVCGQSKDLRMGSCFSCSDFVDGQPLLGGGHELWDRRNPSNHWIVRAQ